MVQQGMTSHQLPLNLVQQPRYYRSTFEVTASNRSAFSFVDNWPQWPAPRLLIIGPQGAGKTHLAHIWAEKSGAEFIQSKNLEVERAVNPGRAQAFVLEDVQETVSERALFHFLNAVAQRRSWLLVTMDREPSRSKFQLPDLKSRLNGIPKSHLLAPDEDLMEFVLVKLFEDRQIAPDPGVITYLSKRIERTVLAAERVVQAIDAKALAKRQAVSLAIAKETLLESPQKPLI